MDEQLPDNVSSMSTTRDLTLLAYGVGSASKRSVGVIDLRTNAGFLYQQDLTHYYGTYLVHVDISMDGKFLVSCVPGLYMTPATVLDVRTWRECMSILQSPV